MLVQAHDRLKRTSIPLHHCNVAILDEGLGTKYLKLPCQIRRFLPITSDTLSLTRRMAHSISREQGRAPSNTLPYTRLPRTVDILL